MGDISFFQIKAPVDQDLVWFDFLLAYKTRCKILKTGGNILLRHCDA
jgi:hypothetical protein